MNVFSTLILTKFKMKTVFSLFPFFLYLKFYPIYEKKQYLFEKKERNPVFCSFDQKAYCSLRLPAFFSPEGYPKFKYCISGRMDVIFLRPGGITNKHNL